MKSLRGKTAIVTGASRGIGLAIAKALAHEGVRLGLLSRSKPGIGGEFVACDLADLDKIPGAVRQLVDRLGTVDFLINNAGIFLEKPVPEIQLADWERILRVNVTTPFLLTREILPGMIARRQDASSTSAAPPVRRVIFTSPPTAPASTPCWASRDLLRSKQSRTAFTFTIFAPAAWTPTSSKAPTSASA